MERYQRKLYLIMGCHMYIKLWFKKYLKYQNIFNLTIFISNIDMIKMVATWNAGSSPDHGQIQLNLKL